MAIGHLLTGGPIPLAVQWLAAALLGGGVVGMLSLRRRAWRFSAAAVTMCGLAGTVAAYVTAAIQPGAPPYAIRITAPETGALVSSPVLLTVCGVRRDGSTQPATDIAHYLVVFVDGHEVPTVDAWRFAETLTPGPHTIRVELVTPSHHAFAPPAIAITKVTVNAGAVAAVPSNC
jgi:hypothetical protein